MNLLVIEDDQKLNRMLCEILEKEGYTVKACTDGEEGAYYLQQNLSLIHISEPTRH